MSQMYSTEQFATAIREKYPNKYDDLDDFTLSQKWVKAKPAYAGQVDLTEPTQPTQPAAPAQPGGLVERTAARGLEMEEVKKQREAGEIGRTEEVVRGLGKAGETIGDVFMIGLGKALRVLDVTGVEELGKDVLSAEPVQKSLKWVGEQAGKGLDVTADTIYKTPGLKQLVDKYDTLPPETKARVADDLKGVMGIIEGLTIVLPAGKVAPAAIKTGEKLAVEAGGLGVEAVAGAGRVVARGTKAITKAGGETTKFGVSQISGLSPETISVIKNMPNEFKEAVEHGLGRVELASRVKKSIDAELSALSSTGKGYETIRGSVDNVVLPKNWFDNIIKKHGLTIEKGKIEATSKSRVREPGDITALNNVYSRYAEKNTFSANEVLNLREDLSNLAKYGEGKTGASVQFARQARSDIDELAKTQIGGLEKLDKIYAPQVKLLKQIKKDYFNKDGTLKDGALNKIANLTGRGKEQILGRLERIEPGITTEIKILKAIEDVELAKGQKVGAYARGAGLGLVATGGNPAAAVLTAIAASPSVIVPVIRWYGKVANKTSSFINGIIKKIQSGIKPNPKESSVISDAVKKLSEKKLIKGAITPDLE